MNLQKIFSSLKNYNTCDLPLAKYFSLLFLFFYISTCYSQNNITYSPLNQTKTSIPEHKEVLKFEKKKLGKLAQTTEYYSVEESFKTTSRPFNPKKSESFSMSLKEINSKSKVKLIIPKTFSMGSFKAKENIDYAIKYLDQSCGLPSNRITGIDEDEDNNLWIAYSGGIAKVSSSTIQIYDAEVGLPDFPITSLKYLNKILYIGTFGGGIIELKNNSFKSLNKQNGFITDLITDICFSNNELYFSTFGEGIIQRKSNGNYVKIISKALATNKIISDITSQNGLVYFVTTDGYGVIRDSKIGLYGQQSGIPKDEYSYITCSIDGEIYLSAKNNFLIRIDSDKIESYSSLQKGDNTINNLFTGKSGKIWVATSSDGIYSLGMSNLLRFNSKNGLTADNLTEIFQDSFDNLWITSAADGINLFNPSNFVSRLTKNTNLNQILVLKEAGEIVYQNEKGGLIFQKRNNIKRLYHPLLKNITSLLFDEQEQCFWITCENGFFQLKDLELIEYQIGTKNSLIRSFTFASIDKKGVIWLNEYNYGLLKFDKKQFYYFPDWSSNENSLTFYSFSDSKNNTWVCGDKGNLSCFANDKITTYTLSRRDNKVKLLNGCEIEPGKYIFGSNVGAILFEKGNFSLVNFPFELKNKRIQSVKYISSTSTLWISTQSGIISIKDNIADYFDEGSGLPSGSFRLNGVSSNGQNIYWTTSKGIIQYIPFRFRNLDIIHTLNLENISLSDLGNTWKDLKDENLISFESLKNSIPQSLQIPLNYNELGFQFSITNWGREKSTRYYYRLTESSDTNWVYFGNTGHLQLKNLAGGKHTVEVKAEMPYQVHSTHFIYSFFVTIPFYQELWFLISVCLFILLATYLVVRSFAEFNFDHFSTLENKRLIVHRVRVISIFIIISSVSGLVFYNELSSYFSINWPLNILVLATTISLYVYSFSGRINTKVLTTLMLINYVLLCSIYLYFVYENGFTPLLSVTCAVFLILSIFIIQGIRNTILFFAIYFIIASILVYISPADLSNKFLYFSAVTQVAFATLIFKRLEDKKLEKILFSDKLLNSAPIFVIVADLNGRIVFINDYTAKQLGFEISEALNYGWWNIRDEEDIDVEPMKKALIHAIKEQKSSIYVNAYTNKKTNQEVIVEWQDTPIEGKYMLGIGTDITKETNQNIELEKLSLVAKKVTNGVIITDQNNEIEWVNDSYLSLMGKSYSELMGVNVSNDFYTQKIAKTYINESGSTDDRKNFEASQITKDGKTKWFFVNSTTVNSSDGKPLKTIHILTDITEDRKLKERHSYILNNAGDIIYSADKYGNFNYINAALSDVLGYNMEELMGKNYTTLIHPDDVQDVAEFYANQIKDRIHSSYKEFRIIAKDKKIKYISQTVTFVLDDIGKIDGFQAIVRDITLLKEIELDKAERNERLRSYTKALARLSKIRSNQEEELEEFYQNVCITASESLNIPRVSIWIFNENKLECAANNDSKPYDVNSIIPASYPIYFNFLQKDLIIQSNDTSITPELDEFKELFTQNNIKALLHQPIRSNGEFIGMLCIEETRTTLNWQEQEVNFTKSLADLVSVTYESDRRRKAEASIKESESNFRMLNETIDDVFWLYDLKEQRLIYISPSCRTVLGVDQEEFYATNNYWTKYIYDEDREKILEAHKDIETIGYYEVEYRIKSENGLKWIYEKSFGIKDVNGEIARTSGICSDITERKETERIVKQLSLVAQKTRNPIVISDENGKIEWVNSAFEELTEYSIDEVIGKKPGDFLQGKDSSPRTIRKIREGIRKNISIKEEIINYTKSGKNYWLELNIDPVFDEKGELINYIAVEQDISDRKKKEALIQAQHLDIINSINYAKRIQNALLPTEQQINNLPIDLVLFNKPKDIIGGDFYWFDEVDNILILAVGDCTGHGVPGALMTSLGINGLINAVSERRMKDPADILRYIDNYITSLLKTSENVKDVKDGMDIGIVAIDLNSKTISFSGAGRPFYYLHNKELIKINGSLKSIGSDFSQFPYETSIINLDQNDQYYMFSDGMVDQFGGDNDKRLGSKQFTQLLKSNQDLSMKNQQDEIYSFFQNWMRFTAQTDDMIWVGFKVK